MCVYVSLLLLHAARVQRVWVKFGMETACVEHFTSKKSAIPIKVSILTKTNLPKTMYQQLDADNLF